MSRRNYTCRRPLSNLLLTTLSTFHRFRSSSDEGDLRMLTPVKNYFHFDRHQTSFRRETIGGLTTFFTMSYIIIVNPKILEAAGIPFGPSMVATILAAFFGTLAMGVFARRPFAVAPYMGENAFIAYTVCGVLGYSWQTALGAIFIGGVLLRLSARSKSEAGWRHPFHNR